MDKAVLEWNNFIERIQPIIFDEERSPEQLEKIQRLEVELSDPTNQKLALTYFEQYRIPQEYWPSLLTK